MKYIFRLLFLPLFFALPLSTVHAQHSSDTIKVMTYNVLNYGLTSTDCPALISANKHVWLRTILNYTNPDIVGFEKMVASSSFLGDTIVEKVFDSVCAGCYSHTPFTNQSGYIKGDMLYFKTSKFGWQSTTTIYSADPNISDINLHTLFYKSPQLALTHDTVFLHVILVHLESGSGSANERATEIAGAMNWLNTHVTSPGNYIFMGDLNTQSSNESCFQQLINSSNPNTLFFDPPNQLGAWDNNPDDFALYLTQSTRTSDPGDCGATGGLDDRFDHLLCTNPIMQGTASVTYVPNSYFVVGQDGQHANKAVNASPANTSVPANVLNALYYMSEHLPVMMQLAIDTTGSQPSGFNRLTSAQDMTWRYNTLVYDKLSIWATHSTPEKYTAAVCDLTGRLLCKAPLNNTGENILPVSNLAEGTYLLVILQNNTLVESGRFVRVGR